MKRMKVKRTEPLIKGGKYQYRQDGPVFEVKYVSEGGNAHLRATTSITGHVLEVTADASDPEGWRGPLDKREVARIEEIQRFKRDEYQRHVKLETMSQLSKQMSVMERRAAAVGV